MRRGLGSVLLVVASLTVVSQAHARDPIRPNPKLTPGAAFSVDTQTVCQRGYAGSARSVSHSLALQAYRRYGIKPVPFKYEIDHLISLQLGGSNAITNLWPESYVTKPYNAHEKDKLEARLHSLVCKGSLSLLAAQQAIRTDWIAAYNKYWQVGWVRPRVPLRVK